MILIIFLVIFLVFVAAIISAYNSNPVSEERKEFFNSTDEKLMEEYRRNLVVSEQEYFEYSLLVEPYVADKDAYDRNIRILISELYNADRYRNVQRVNSLAKYLVKYYASPILKFGTKTHKKMLKNMIFLLKSNGLIE